MDSDTPEINLEDFASTPADAEPTAEHEAHHEEIPTPINDPNDHTRAIPNIDAVYEIPVKITAVVGSTTMPVNQLIKLGRGAVVELNKKLGETVDIYANNRLIAKGEIVVMDDDHIGVTMTEIVSSAASAAVAN
ncbi:MAG: flagellar motor switch protein FliN [Acetobacter sp.]|nr:flagellar motor switch protein FliN [Acetobacter sp.]